MATEQIHSTNLTFTLDNKLVHVSCNDQNQNGTHECSNGDGKSLCFDNIKIEHNSYTRRHEKESKICN